MLIRVMQVSRGCPLTSALHEPHFPALQFHRMARSLTWIAWIRCRTSRTTIPSSTGTPYSWKAPPPGRRHAPPPPPPPPPPEPRSGGTPPPPAPPRHTRTATSAIYFPSSNR